MSDIHCSQADMRESIHGFAVAGATNELTEELWINFERLLRESDDACRLYAGYVGISVLLPSILSAVSDDEAPSSGVFDPEQQSPAISLVHSLPNLFHQTLGYFSEGMPLAYLLATVITGLGLLVGSLIPASHPEPTAHMFLPSVVAEPKTEHVGRITGMVNCNWKNAGLGIRDWGLERKPGKQVALGDKLALSSGLIEITYNTGAKVILQGPMTYQIETNGGYLAVGKLTGKLEERGESGIHHSAPIARHSPNPQSSTPNPFAIRTPSATVIDLGTEFGVEVTKEGDSVVQVKTGAVDVVTQDDAGHVQLQAGGPRNSARVDADTRKIVALHGTLERFVYALPKPSISAGAVVEWSGTRQQGSLSPAKDDLLQTRLAKVINDDPEPPRYERSATPSNLFDGTLYGPKNEDVNIDCNKFSYTPRDGTSLTFVLDTIHHREGYTIDGIDLFTGYYWMRVGQKYKVEFAQVGHEDWLPVVCYDHSALQDEGFREARSRIRNRIADEPLAIHVDRIRITFYDTAELIDLNQRPGCVYREIDVLGSPTITDKKLKTVH